MTRLLTLAFVAGILAGPVFAQDAATMVCKDYAAMDNAGKMAIIAELQSMNCGDGVLPDDELGGHRDGAQHRCAKDPDKLLQDAMKEIHKM